MKNFFKTISITIAVSILILSCSVTVRAEEEINVPEDEHIHTVEYSLQYVGLLLPTETEDGHFPYYRCTKCTKFFADENGTVEVTIDKVTLPRKEHYTIVSSTNEYVCGSKEKVTYVTNLPSEDFGENFSVYIGEQRVPESEYALSPDSPFAIITINGKAFENQAKGTYSVTIKSKTDENVKISTSITISEPKHDPSDDSAPAIDFGQVVLIVSVSMLAIVCVVLTFLFIMNKRKRPSDKSDNSDK